MKRLLMPVLIGLCGVALGAAAAQQLNTYPYVPDELNEPCGKTLFEWNLAANRIESVPVKLDANFDLVGLVGEAKPQALLVRATLAPNARAPKGPDDTQWRRTILAAATQLERILPLRFGTEENQENIVILGRIGDRLVFVRSAHGGAEILPPDATREQQLEVLSRALPSP
jgi:hypothetical protein